MLEYFVCISDAKMEYSSLLSNSIFSLQHGNTPKRLRVWGLDRISHGASRFFVLVCWFAYSVLIKGCIIGTTYGYVHFDRF